MLKQKSEGALGSRKETREETTMLKGTKQAGALCTVPHEVCVGTLGDFLATLLNSIFWGELPAWKAQLTPSSVAFRCHWLEPPLLLLQGCWRH